MVDTGSPTAPLRVLVLSQGATHTRALQTCLTNRGALVTGWARLPANRDEWAPLSHADVVLLACNDDVDSEFVTIEQIRDATPLAEIVCVCESVEVETAVESLRAGVFAVVPYQVAEDRLVEVLSAACARRRRAELRMQALDSGAERERPAHRAPSGTKRPNRPSD